MTMQTDVKYYTVNEVAALFRVDKYTVRRWAKKGERGAIKVVGQWRFPADQILK